MSAITAYPHSTRRILKHSLKSKKPSRVNKERLSLNYSPKKFLSLLKISAASALARKERSIITRATASTGLLQTLWCSAGTTTQMAWVSTEVGLMTKLSGTLTRILEFCPWLTRDPTPMDQGSSSATDLNLVWTTNTQFLEELSKAFKSALILRTPLKTKATNLIKTSLLSTAVNL